MHVKNNIEFHIESLFCVQVSMANIAWSSVRVHRPNLFVMRLTDAFVELDSAERIV